jgi:hypothetical protein
MYRPSRLLTKNDGVVPRNVYRRSLVRPHLLPSKASLLRSRKRPARTPPSTFLFLPIHLSNSPGTMAVPLPDSPGSRRSPNLPTEIGRLVTLSVRSFAGAPSRRKAGRRAVVEALYGRPLHLVNTKSGQNSWQVRTVEMPYRAVTPARSQGLRAALAPHSSRVVRVGERPVITVRIAGNLAVR